MGNNESLPPPPPPGQPQPGQPPAPPTGPPPSAGPPTHQPPPPPGYVPPTQQFPPTTEFPVPQQFPPTQAFPGGPPGGFPPQGSSAFQQPAEPPKKKTGLLIAGGLIAAAVAVAVVLIVTGGNDDETVAPAPSLPATTISTRPVITTPNETIEITLPVITEPLVTEPVITEPPATDPVVATTVLSGGAITDDLGVFTIVLPDGLVVDTTPITTQDKFVLPSVAGAADLDGFYGDDVTPGMTSVVVGQDVNSTTADVLAFLEPGDGICTGRDQTDDYPTALGNGMLLKLDGCGDGTASKVILVAAIEGTSSIVALYVQGPGAATDLLPQAQTVFESIRLL